MFDEHDKKQINSGKNRNILKKKTEQKQKHTEKNTIDCEINEGGKKAQKPKAIEDRQKTKNSGNSRYRNWEALNEMTDH